MAHSVRNGYGRCRSLTRRTPVSGGNVGYSHRCLGGETTNHRVRRAWRGSLAEIAACGVDIKAPSIKAPSAVAKLLENRQKIAIVARETNAAVMRNQPHVRQRKTSNGVVSVNTNNWFLVEEVYHFSVSIGPKKLSLNGREVFRGGTLAETCAKLSAIEAAALAGQLDAQITAMFALSDDQKVRMRDGKFISRMAKAEVAGKTPKMADRARLAQLLMDPVHNENYSAAVAA